MMSVKIKIGFRFVYNDGLLQGGEQKTHFDLNL